MSLERIQDKNFRTIGYVETSSDGWKKLLDPSNRVLGYFDPSRNITLDTNYRTIGSGDQLLRLLP